MSKKSQRRIIEIYRELLALEDCEWVALSIQTKKWRITLHSKNAPKRPKGIG